MSKAQGERLRALRRQKGLTQHELGSICDIAAPSISAIENGGIELGMDRAERLGKALGVHPSCLVYPDLSISLTED